MKKAATLVSLAFLTAASAVGCGGGEPSPAPSGPAGSTRSAAAAKAYVAPANAVCRQMLRETRKLGRHFIAEVAASPSHDLKAAATDGLIRPGVAVLARVAARLRAIEVEHPDPSFAAYVGLYEPLLQLGRLRLAAGEAENGGEERNLEAQMEAVGLEQRIAARLAGLRACQVDFLHVLISSWSGG